MADILAFFDAVRERATDRVRTLLAQDPNLVQAKSEGTTALHLAAIGNDRMMVRVLLGAGADVNARDDTYQMVPIGWANEEGHAEMVRFLYDHGAEVDLHRAAAYGLIDRVRDLVKVGRRQINAVAGGWTPLQLATLWGQVEVVQLLLARGADPLERDPFGRTALEIARDQAASNARSTPLVGEERRRQIVDACARIAAVLTERGVRP